MKKKLIIMCSSLMLLTGCGFNADIYVDSENKILRTESTAYVTDEEYPSVDKENHTYTKVDLNGTSYYQSEKMTSEKTWDELSSGYDVVSEDTVILTLNDPMLNAEYDFFNLRMHLPFDVAYTNGELLGDRSVQFDGSTSNIVMATSRSEVLRGENVTLKNVTKGRVIKNNQILGIDMLANKRGSLTYRISSDDSLLLSAKISDGKNSLEINPYTFTSPMLRAVGIVKDGRLEISTLRNGKYTLTITLVSGYEKSISYYIDTQRPTVTIKNKKVYCKDKKLNSYASGIKSVKVNGKTMKNSYKVKSGDKIVVTDKAGNKTIKEIK